MRLTFPQYLVPAKSRVSFCQRNVRGAPYPVQRQQQQQGMELRMGVAKNLAYNHETVVKLRAGPGETRQMFWMVGSVKFCNSTAIGAMRYTHVLTSKPPPILIKALTAIQLVIFDWIGVGATYLISRYPFSRCAVTFAAFVPRRCNRNLSRDVVETCAYCVTYMRKDMWKVQTASGIQRGHVRAGVIDMLHFQ